MGERRPGALADFLLVALSMVVPAPLVHTGITGPLGLRGCAGEVTLRNPEDALCLGRRGFLAVLARSVRSCSAEYRLRTSVLNHSPLPSRLAECRLQAGLRFTLPVYFPSCFPTVLGIRPVASRVLANHSTSD